MNCKDIKPQWLNVARRLQSVSRQNDGIGILHLKVMVNQDGNPIFWVEPDIIKLEPKGSVNFDLLRKNLTEKEFELLLHSIFEQ